MNDVNKNLDEKREQAKKHLPTLVHLVNSESNDGDFISFIQEVVDNYMMNVCKLGRRE